MKSRMRAWVAMLPALLFAGSARAGNRSAAVATAAAD